MAHRVCTSAVVATLAVVFCLGSSASALAADAGAKCEASKLKEAAKYGSCRLKADAKSALTGAPADYAKCESKFGAKWMIIEGKAGPGTCPSEGDATGVGDRIVGQAADIATLLAGIDIAECGNNLLEGNEQCDGTDLGGITCSLLGYASGVLACTAGCSYNVNGCTPYPPPSTCGNGVINAGEDCDQGDLGGESCGSLALGPGLLACGAGCIFDTSGCGAPIDAALQGTWLTTFTASTIVGTVAGTLTMQIGSDGVATGSGGVTTPISIPMSFDGSAAGSGAVVGTTDVESGAFSGHLYTNGSGSGSWEAFDITFGLGLIQGTWTALQVNPKYVFVANQFIEGDATVAGYDNLCNVEASAVGLPGTYKAWISTTTTGPATTFTHATGQYLRTDDVVVANNWADLTDGTLAAPINRGSTGNLVSGLAWSNTAANGNPANLGGSALADSCSDWTTQFAQGAVGDISQTDSRWTSLPYGQGGQQFCSDFFGLSFYCFQQ